MPTVPLADRAVILIGGAEAGHFLQNIVTTDLDTVRSGEARPGALLSPQGKILFDFLISRRGEGCFRLDCPADAAPDLLRRLTLYRLRSKVDLALRDQGPVAVSWDIDSAFSESDSPRDLRFPPSVTVRRHYGDPPPADATQAEWTALRVAHAVAESGADFAPGEAFPHDVLLDQNGGVGFRKGCYVGQEVVSRMQHRGTARRRVLMVRGAADLPEPGTAVAAGGRTLGALGSASGRDGLAILRIDRVKEAVDAGTEILAGEVAVEASIPAWADFTFPEAAAGED